VLSIDISLLEHEDLIGFFDENIQDFSNFEVKIDFLSDYAQSKMIRDAILYLFEMNHINVPWKNRFALISDELVNNSIEYGSMPLDVNTICIKFVPTPKGISVSVEVSDTGRGAEAKTSDEMEQIRKLKEMRGFDSYLGKRGRGLFQLINNLVDELYFRDGDNGGLTVGIRKELEYVSATVEEKPVQL
jgi:anti-sigma regulatory factor (Ser/Thr protein kinase)